MTLERCISTVRELIPGCLPILAVYLIAQRFVPGLPEI